LTGWMDMEIPHSNVYKKELECKFLWYRVIYLVNSTQ
jgi:hypothetical protein